MAGIEDVLGRLRADPAFAARLAADPGSALAGYELSADDLSELARLVGASTTGKSVVEQRTSRAGFFGLVAQVTDGRVIIRGPSSPEEEPV